MSRDGRLALQVGAPPKNAVMTLAAREGHRPGPSGSPVADCAGFRQLFSGRIVARYCRLRQLRHASPNVFIQYLQSGAKHQVSIDGGNEPVFCGVGRELFFRSGRR